MKNKKISRVKQISRTHQTVNCGIINRIVDNFSDGTEKVSYLVRDFEALRGLTNKIRSLLKSISKKDHGGVRMGLGSIPLNFKGSLPHDEIGLLLNLLKKNSELISAVRKPNPSGGWLYSLDLLNFMKPKGAIIRRKAKDANGKVRRGFGVQAQGGFSLVKKKEKQIYFDFLDALRGIDFIGPDNRHGENTRVKSRKLSPEEQAFALELKQSGHGIDAITKIVWSKFHINSQQRPIQATLRSRIARLLR